MRNVFLLLRRFATFLTFLFLQILCITMVFNFNSHHKVIGQDVADNITGKVHEQRAKVKGFLQLRATADSIAVRNAELLNKKPDNWLVLDTGIKEVADYIPVDTLGNMKKIVHFVYKPAQVVYNTTNNDKRNYLIIARGTKDGVGPDMAVIGAESNAVIGKVVSANENYAYVMTLYHQRSRIPAKLAKTNENGIITWDGKNNRNVILTRISNSVELKLGDSVVTSTASDIFPENLLIGTISDIKKDNTNNEHILTIKTAANYNHINYVQVVENKQQKELRKTVEEAEKQLGISTSTNPK